MIRPFSSVYYNEQILETIKGAAVCDVSDETPSDEAAFEAWLRGVDNDFRTLLSGAIDTDGALKAIHDQIDTPPSDGGVE